MNADPKADLAALAERFDATLAVVRAAQVELAQSTDPRDAALRVQMMKVLERMISAMASARVLGRVEAAHNMLQILRTEGGEALVVELEGNRTLH